jgi:hypothetical protein
MGESRHIRYFSYLVFVDFSVPLSLKGDWYSSILLVGLSEQDSSEHRVH